MSWVPLCARLQYPTVSLWVHWTQGPTLETVADYFSSSVTIKTNRKCKDLIEIGVKTCQECWHTGTSAHTHTYVRARHSRHSSLWENDNELPGVQITASLWFESSISSGGIFGSRPLARLWTKVFLLTSKISSRLVFNFSMRVTGEIIFYKINY